MISIDARWLSASGIGTYLHHVIPGLVQYFSRTKIVLLGDPKQISENAWGRAPNVEVRDLRAPMYSIEEQWKLARVIPRGARLHFATHYPIPLFYLGPLLVTVYDLFHLAMPAIVGGLHKRAYASYMFRAVRQKAAAIITISHFTKQEFIRLVGIGPQETHAIHLGVDEGWFRIPDRPSPHGRPYVVYVGNVKPHKNLPTLLEAFSRLQQRVPHDLVIIGKREGFITGERLPEPLLKSLGERVYFTGRVSDDVLRQYVRHADAMVFPSFYEGFGLPPLEAMAAGCPVITSNAAAIPEVCGEAAVYFDPHSVDELTAKLECLLGDANARQRYRVQGLAHAQRFTWGKCIESTSRVIEGLLCGRIEKPTRKGTNSKALDRREVSDLR